MQRTHSTPSTLRTAWRAIAACVTALVAAMAIAATAQAEFGIATFDGEVSNQDGSAFTQAGGHPWKAGSTIVFNQHLAEGFLPTPDGDVKVLRVDLPAGFGGNPNALPKCSEDMLADTGTCPDATQVGLSGLTAGFILVNSVKPVFNMEPPPGVAASFAYTAAGVVVHLNARVRSDGDYGVTLEVDGIPQTLPLLETWLTFWGVPADSSHDGERGACLSTPESDVCPAGVPRRPFLTNPTACTAPGVGLETVLSIDSWQAPGAFRSASFFSHLPAPDQATQVGPEGCDQVPFEASLAAAPDVRRSGAPAGFEFELRTPQSDNPDGIANAHLKKAVVRLPEGVRVSPSAADGLQACAPDQIGLKSLAAPSCPAGSKIGRVQIDTPLLEEPMDGSVYLAKQGDNPFGSLLAMYLVARGPGVIVKLPGRVDPDPRTGRLTATFDDNPQLPFDRLLLELPGGPRAALTNPSECGTYTTQADLTSWSGKTVHSESSFTISRDGNGEPCPPRGFSPAFMAGLESPAAGSSSPFSLAFGRGDSDQTLGGIAVDMPRGLTGAIASATLCDDGRAAAGTCGEESRIGSVTTSAGPGSNPFSLPGRVYVTGSYKGAPYGLSVVVPAVAGPFDLGTVVVRSAISVDRTTAQLRVVSDPLPTILEGIPLQVRDVRVDVDKPGFIVAPSSCEAKRVEAQLSSAEGATAAVGSRFQVGDCAALPFRPRLKLRLTGRRQIRTGSHPGVRAQVNQSGIGEAGIRKAVVTLPRSLALDPDNAQDLCEFVDGTKPDLEKHCPKGSIVGRARAKTPLLKDDLVGDVYFVKNVERHPKTGALIRKLPMIVVALRGEIAINLVGKSSTAKDGRLVNTFGSVPDAPISQFNLNVDGGGSGILAVTRTRKGRISLCAKPKSHVAAAAIDGQNGKIRDFTTRVKTPCASRR